MKRLRDAFLLPHAVRGEGGERMQPYGLRWRIGDFFSTLLKTCSRCASIALGALVSPACGGDWQSGRWARDPFWPPQPPPVGADGGAPAEPAELGAIEIAAEHSSPPPDRMPVINVIAPKANQTIPLDKVDSFLVKLDVRNWAIAPQGA